MTIGRNIKEITEIKELQDETKREIFNNKLIEIAEFYLPIYIPIENLIDILLECDKENYMNQTNYTKNPKLGLTIIENAFHVASAKSKESIEIDDFIEALKQDNINMSQTNKNIAIESLKKIKNKTNYNEEKESIPFQKKKHFRTFFKK